MSVIRKKPNILNRSRNKDGLDELTESNTNVDEMTENPWQVDSIQAFYCLKCPECEYNTLDENYFEDHAIENHPLSFVLFNKQFEQKRNFKEEYDVVNVKEEHVSYSNEMEDYSNFESSSTDVPGNYPEVLMTEGKGYGDESDRVNYELNESVFEQNSGQIINDEQALNAQEANEDGKYVCKICGNLFKHKADMKRHVQEKHWNMKAFQCLLCDYASFRKNTLTKHIQSVHEKLKPFSCDRCDKKFASKAHCREHVESVHEGVTHNCQFCEKIYTKKGHLSQHMKHNHKDKIKKSSSSFLQLPDPIIFPEVLINETFEEENSFDNESYPNVSGYKSEQFEADEQVQSSSNLSNNYEHEHYNDVHEEKNEHFETLDEQALNSQEANEEGKFVCKICGNLFKHKADMKRHVEEKHWNLKPFQCLQCDFATTRKNALNKHVEAIHEKIKSFGCSQCDKTFSKKQHRKEHVESVHEGKIYNCELCVNWYTKKGHLRDHIKKNHTVSAQMEPIQ